WIFDELCPTPSPVFDSVGWDIYLSSVNEPDQPLLPRAFSLKQNYPNPFNPSTIIKFDLPKSCKVTVEIYNILAQKIKTVVDKEMTAGYGQTVIWDGTMDNGRPASTGVYFYQVKADNAKSSKKMILIK
ncbi:MAG: T9SS type A sorting domain-containing protein, partial [candidate division Zixibacteria bacterium]|nr:T9SS type A sorting domain-containing protein [candidate division Zixibacteria bacterium]